jgi:putative peptide zinc metalloprotease protein
MTGTFSEHWYRVANQRVALRPTVVLRKQWFRGEKWFVVVDPLNNSYFRLAPGAHDFLQRLDGRATVQEVWEKCLDLHPDDAPGQEAVIQLLSQLHRSSLLRGEVPADNEKLFEHYAQRRKREGRAWLNLMFLRIPVLDPDRFLQRTMCLVRWLMGPLGVVLWLGTVGAAVKVALEHADQLAQGAHGILAPANLPLLYFGLVFIKALHEFGHAYACRRFGGEVHQMGVALIYFSPVPYVDASASWTFQSKWQRIFVSSAGMIVELLVAALAMFVWANTGSGTLHSLAYNMMFVASVTTLLFNANPLMRYDGYYILADLIELPNLQQRSTEMLRWLAERWLFGLRIAESPARTWGETIFLSCYGAAAMVYRVLLTAGIALFISGRFLILGVVLALGLAFSMTVRPVWKFAMYLASNPRLARVRLRGIGITGGCAVALIVLLGVLPMPNHFRAPGVIRAEEFSDLYTNVPGTLVEVVAPTGSAVNRGQPLLRFASAELELETAAAAAGLAKVLAEERRALERSAAEIGPIRSRREAMEKRIRRLQEKSSRLLIIAPHSGTWFAPDIQQSLGQWFPRGGALGKLIQMSDFRFTAVISQEEAGNLFNNRMHQGQVRLAGAADQMLPVRNLTAIPAQQEMLPSAALGWGAGGELAVASNDATGRRAAETFFELRAHLQTPDARYLRHGRSGNIRVELQREPLLSQWYRKLRQLLQKRYQI